MNRDKDPDFYTNGRQICEYENLGKELMEAVMAYGHHLRENKIPTPVLSLAGLDAFEFHNRESTQERNRVVELAQKLLAMTRDPDTSLLLDSLQVLSLFYASPYF